MVIIAHSIYISDSDNSNDGNSFDCSTATVAQLRGEIFKLEQRVSEESMKCEQLKVSFVVGCDICLLNYDSVLWPNMLFMGILSLVLMDKKFVKFSDFIKVFLAKSRWFCILQNALAWNAVILSFFIFHDRYYCNELFETTLVCISNNQQSFKLW